MLQEYQDLRIISGATSLAGSTELLQHWHIFYDIWMADQTLAILSHYTLKRLPFLS
jgi:hypothetical protein